MGTVTGRYAECAGWYQCGHGNAGVGLPVQQSFAAPTTLRGRGPRQLLGGWAFIFFDTRITVHCAVQPGTAALPAVLPDRALLATDLVSAMSSFVITPGSLNLNAIVHLALTFTVGGEQLSLNHEVGLRNVP